MIIKKCSIEGCSLHDPSQSVSRLYDNQPYCQRHYEDEVYRALISEFESWDLGKPAPSRFQYLLDRISDEMKWKTEGGSYLSQARIRDRCYKFEKTQNGCVFRIIRHLNAFRNLYVSKRVVQTWEANIGERTLKLIKTRRWTKADPDR